MQAALGRLLPGRWLAWLAPLFMAVPAEAQVGEPATVTAARSFSVRRAPGPIKVDGNLDDPGWVDAESIAIAFEISPGYNTPAKVGGSC